MCPKPAALVNVSDYVAAWHRSPFGREDGPPWRFTQSAELLIHAALSALGSGFKVEDAVAIHRSAVVESGSVVKAPAIIGPKCYVGATAYLRGGTYLEQECIVGPGSELKTSFMFSGSKIAHLNFIGDSILGSGVNVEAGAIIANHRNELEDKRIRIMVEGEAIDTGVDKFGAIVGDGARIGANAVIAPGAVILPHRKIGRLQLVDQSPDA